MRKLIILCSLVLLLSACSDDNNDMSDSDIRKAFPAADFLSNCTFQEVEYSSEYDANGSYYKCTKATNFTNYINTLTSAGFTLSTSQNVSAYVKQLNNKGYAWHYKDESSHYDVFWLIYHDLDKL